jgi:hypothetical protein
MWPSPLNSGTKDSDTLASIKSTTHGIEGAIITPLIPCEICLQEKAKREPITHHQLFSRSSTPLEKIHVDLCGAFSTPTIGRAKIFATLTDDAIKKHWILLLKRKSDFHAEFNI